MDSSFSFSCPAQVDSVANPKGAKDEGGRGILRLIQIRSVWNTLNESDADLASQATPNSYVGSRLTSS